MALDFSCIEKQFEKELVDELAEAHKTSITGEPFTYIDYWQYRDWYPYYLTGGYCEVEKYLKDTEVFEMYVYNIFLVNTKECEVVQQYKNIVAESEKMAAVEISMDPTAKKALRDGELKLIFNQIGGFDKYKK